MSDIGRRLCFYQFTFRIVVGCLIRGRIDLIKGFTRFDVAAFGKITVQNDTTYPGRTSATRYASVLPGNSVFTASGALLTI